MSVDVSDWSTRKKLKHSLLRRAFTENRGSEVILLIQWRLAMEHHKNADGVKAARDFELENAGQPRALRSLNLISKSMGFSTIYKDTVVPPKEKTADIYIKPGFLERVLERAAAPMLPVYDYLNTTRPDERISFSFTRLTDILHDFSQDNIMLRSIIVRDRMEEAIENLRTMPVASNDKAMMTTAEEAVNIRPAYNDNEEALSADEFVSNAVTDFFDEDPTNDPVHEEMAALAARHKGPKFGWQ